MDTHDIVQFMGILGTLVVLIGGIWRMFAMHGQGVREMTEIKKDVERLADRQKEDREAFKDLREKNSESFRKIFEKQDETNAKLAQIAGQLQAILGMKETRK